jgi:hypothetical protein
MDTLSELLYRRARQEGLKVLNIKELIKLRGWLIYEIGKDKIVGLEDEILMKFKSKLEKELDKKLWGPN